MWDRSKTGSSGSPPLKVLVVGAGGLSSGLLPSLFMSGDPPFITIIDGDRVSLPNLHRQILYDRGDLGMSKAALAAAKLARMRENIEGRLSFVEGFLTPGNAVEIAGRHDLIIDCSDSFQSKFLASDLACVVKTPAVIAGAVTMKGQLVTVSAGGRPCYRCLAQAPPHPGEVERCDRVGVLGPVPVAVGALQGMECMRIIRGEKPMFSSRLLHIDFSARMARKIDFSPAKECRACGHSPSITFNYEEYSVESPDEWITERSDAPGGIYSRQEILEGVGAHGQEKIDSSFVACERIDAAASAALAMLSAAGVGNFILGDSSPVSREDARTGVGFSIEDAGAARSEAAARIIARHNPSARIHSKAPRGFFPVFHLSPSRERVEKTFMEVTLQGDEPAALIFAGAAGAASLLLEILRS